MNQNPPGRRTSRSKTSTRRPDPGPTSTEAGSESAAASANGRSTLSAELVHASPGRLRLRLRELDLAKPAIGRAREQLAAVPGVRDVQLNPLARSFVLLYDAKSSDIADLFAAIERSGIHVTPDSSVADRGLLSRPLDQSIEAFFGGADEKVRAKSEGFVGLRTLLPVGLAALAAREVLAGRLAAAAPAHHGARHERALTPPVVPTLFPSCP